MFPLTFYGTVEKIFSFFFRIQLKLQSRVKKEIISKIYKVFNVANYITSNFCKVKVSSGSFVTSGGEREKFCIGVP